MPRDSRGVQGPGAHPEGQKGLPIGEGIPAVLNGLEKERTSAPAKVEGVNCCFVCSVGGPQKFWSALDPPLPPVPLFPIQGPRGLVP